MPRSRYAGWWEASWTLAAHKERVAAALARARKNEGEYRKAADATGIPWELIACIHELEATASMKHHIANGDPLDDYTVHVPKGEPKGLHPPWTWHEAAIVEIQEIHRPDDGTWTIRAMLEAAERFNGLGYRKRQRRSPYLTGSTVLDTGGKFVADHVFDATVRSKQVGVLALLHALEDDGEQLPPW